jgi:hypothetical protein
MATDEEKKAAEEQRKNIDVEVSKNPKLEAEQKETNKEEEKGDDEVKEEKEEAEVKEEIKDNKEEIEAKDEEVEELEDEKKDAKTEKERARIQKRIDKLTADKQSLKEEVERLKAQIAAKPDDENVYTKEQVEELAKQEAKRLKAEADFDSDCNKLANEAEKLDKKFQAKVHAMAEDAGAIPVMMIGILANDIENGGAVLSYLTNNVDEYEEIKDLSPARMALKLNKISEKLLKPKKEITKVPPSKEPVGGNGTTPEQRANEKDDMDTWVKKRNKEAEEHRRQKLGLVH